MAMPIEERRRRKAEYSRRWHAANGERARDASRRYRERNTDRVKARNAAEKFMRHNITADIYQAQLAAQGGCCAICGTTEPGAPRFHIDHDHSCCSGEGSCGKCLRGLLCRSCNMGIGLLKDNPSVLASAVEYLSHGKTWTAPILPADRKKEKW